MGLCELLVPRSAVSFVTVHVMAVREMNCELPRKSSKLPVLVVPQPECPRQRNPLFSIGPSQMLKHALPFITLVTMLIVMTDRTLADEPRSPGILKSEWVFDPPPVPSCHASTIVETPKGLVVAWFAGTDEKETDVGIWLSRQVDGKWSAARELVNGSELEDKDYPCWNPVLFQPKTGPLLLFYKVGPDPSNWWGMLITSDDAGQTWSKPRKLPEGVLGPIKNKPIQLSNGDLLCGSSSEHAGWRVHFERSSDLGKTWQLSPPVNDGKEIGAIQPSLLLHPEGRLQAIGRTRQGKVFEIWSTDEGRTWAPMTLTSLPNPNSGTDAVTLRDGRHLLVYNHTRKGRSPLNVAVSADGKQWQAAAVLESEPGEYSYPAVIQAADGLVHITYTWKRERIKHAVLDPAKLRLQPFVNGEWPKP